MLPRSPNKADQPPSPQRLIEHINDFTILFDGFQEGRRHRGHVLLGADALPRITRVHEVHHHDAIIRTVPKIASIPRNNITFRSSGRDENRKHSATRFPHLRVIFLLCCCVITFTKCYNSSKRICVMAIHCLREETDECPTI